MQKIEEKLKKVFESKVLVKLLFGLGILILVLLIFLAGTAVGFRKASFERAWGDNYYENFGMPHRGFGVAMMNNFPNAHGAIGKIIKIQLPAIIVEDKDKTEKVILITDDTQIEKTNIEILTTDLQLDDFIVVIGTPNDKGQIEAKFIRVIPNPAF